MSYIPYNTNKIELSFYQTDNNRTPFYDFLSSLDNRKAKEKILRSLSLIKEDKSLLKEPLSKHLKDGIFELRIWISNLNIRILYFYFEKELVITNAFLKKTNKTPMKEINKAKRYRQDYINRKGDQL